MTEFPQQVPFNPLDTAGDVQRSRAEAEFKPKPKQHKPIAQLSGYTLKLHAADLARASSAVTSDNGKKFGIRNGLGGMECGME